MPRSPKAPAGDGPPGRDHVGTAHHEERRASGDSTDRLSQSHFGDEQTFTTDLPQPGKHIFGVQFTVEGADEYNQPTGTTQLHVDDEVVDEGSMRIMFLQYSLCGEGLSIGYDAGDAVSRTYKPTFKFTGGEIIQVVFDVADETYEDAEHRLAALVARD